MQDCFRQYPEVYGAELANDEAEDAPPAIEGGDKELHSAQDQERAAQPAAGKPEEADAVKPPLPEVAEKTPAPSVHVQDAEEGLTPKRATDATEANSENK